MKAFRLYREKGSRYILIKQVKMVTFNGLDLEQRLGMTSCIWRHRYVIMILFTYLCSKICLLLNTPAPVGTTLRCRRNSRRFKNSQIELCMVDKGFGGRQYQKTTLASNPKRDYIHTCLFTIHHVLLLLVENRWPVKMGNITLLQFYVKQFKKDTPFSRRSL
jgi:hypothetical protein